MADAVLKVLDQQGQSKMPQPVGKIDNRSIPGPGGSIPIRVYSPQGNGLFPIIVYYHGGGWVMATIDTYDASARALSNAANAIVVSVEYRKRPNTVFPRLMQMPMPPTNGRAKMVEASMATRPWWRWLEKVRVEIWPEPSR